MHSRARSIACIFVTSTLLSSTSLPARCQDPTPNSVEVPTQILKTGISLTSETVSPNSAQVADIIGLTPVIKRLQTLREQVGQLKGEAPTLENLALRHQLIVLKRSERGRLRLDSADRLFWVWLSRFWSNWRSVAPCEARNGYRLAAKRIPLVLEMEESARRAN